MKPLTGILLCCVLLGVFAADASSQLIKLCPPGGRTFMLAWSLACEMKKRKKRSAPFPRHRHYGKQMSKRGERQATLIEVQNICCNHGCELRNLLSYCDPFGSLNS